MKKLGLILLVLIVSLNFSRAEVVYPKPSDPPRLVNDFTKTLDAGPDGRPAMIPGRRAATVQPPIGRPRSRAAASSEA